MSSLVQFMVIVSREALAAGESQKKTEASALPLMVKSQVECH